MFSSSISEVNLIYPLQLFFWLIKSPSREHKKYPINCGFLQSPTLNLLTTKEQRFACYFNFFVDANLLNVSGSKEEGDQHNDLDQKNKTTEGQSEENALDATEGKKKTTIKTTQNKNISIFLNL